jgi:RNA polymerase sigma-70 factor (ECF subfamily)
MSPETRAFLELVREAEGPAPGDERRVFDAVRTAIVSEPPVAAKAGAAKSTTGFVLSKASGLKLLGALVAVSTSATLVAVMASSGGVGDPLPAPLRVAAQDPLSLPLHIPETPTAPSAPLPNAAGRTIVDRQDSANSAPAPARAARSTSLRKELALLADVQAALEHGDGSTALRRLDAHVTVDRQFIAERQAARILALCAVGRLKDARDAAAAFLHANPGSVQRTAVERSCAVAKSTDLR